jgi:integrase
MAHGNLDDPTIRAAKGRERVYRLSDGGGLLLEVHPDRPERPGRPVGPGPRSWLCRVTVAGKRKDIGLGGYPTVSLKEARNRAAAARKLAETGGDPAEERQRIAAERVAQRVAKVAAKERTFRNIAAECVTSKAPEFKNPRTALMWTASLEAWAHPTLGDMPIADIDRAAVRRAIDPVWTSRPATAKKVLRRIATVLRYAAAHGWRLNDNPADVRMLRLAGLPKLPGGRGQPSLPWARMPAFMAALDRMPGLGALALRLLALTALRSGEVRNARWSWVSFDGVPTLTIPGEVMKAKKSSDVQPHRVPLAEAALATLARAYGEANGTSAKVADLPKLAALARDALIFPSAKRTAPLSDMALSAVLRRMNADKPEDMPPPWRDADGRTAVPHGLRSSFSTWVDDTRPEEREAAEKALAHEVGNKVSGAYRRSDLFTRRAALMQEWAEYCTALAAGGAAGSGSAALAI